MNIPSLSSLLSSLPALSNNKLGSPPASTQADTKAGSKTDPKASDKTKGTDLLSQASSALSRIGDALGKRVSQLNDAVTGMASQLAQGFAKYLLGDAADGASISFDQTSIASSSSFSAAVMQSQGPNGSQSAAGFSLEDSSEFKGHGVITTKDGRSFEFEVEISYSSSMQAVAAQSSSSTDTQNGQGQGDDTSGQNGQGNGQGSGPVRGHGGHHGHGHRRAGNADDSQAAQQTTPSAQANPLSSPLFANFAGNAADLLDRLTSEPIRLPFTLNLPAATAATPATGSNTATTPSSAASTSTPAVTTASNSKDQSQSQTQSDSQGQALQGSMLLKLLNLPDGPRYLDLLPQPTDNSTPAGRVDARA